METQSLIQRRTPGPFTWDDFVALAEDDVRELINGHLIDVEAPNYKHEKIVMWLGTRLTVWAETGPGGDVIGSSFKVQISSRRGVMPDIQYFRPENVPENPKALTAGRPDLAVEVVSDSSKTFDRVTKLNWYAGKGIPEYWIVDPEERSFVRHILREGHYVVEPHEGDDVFAPDAFPGLEIRLSELWGVSAPKPGHAEGSASGEH